MHYIHYIYYRWGTIGMGSVFFRSTWNPMMITSAHDSRLRDTGGGDDMDLWGIFSASLVGDALGSGMEGRIRCLTSLAVEKKGTSPLAFHEIPFGPETSSE